jgi:hypothetical protein
MQPTPTTASWSSRTGSSDGDPQVHRVLGEKACAKQADAGALASAAVGT